MYNILAAIGLITILAILFFLYLNSIDRKKEEEKDNYDLAKYSDKCENIEKNASSVDEVHILHSQELKNCQMDKTILKLIL